MDAPARKTTILFLCTGNTCRSQMAEAWTRRLWPDRFEAYSAGVEAISAVDPRAVHVMAEAGVDIAQQRPKTVDALPEKNFDYVITLCGHANENCPYFPGPAQVLHRGFEDPPRLAEHAASEEEALGHYRRIRDEIREFVSSLPEWLSSQGGAQIPSPFFGPIHA